MGSMRHYLPLVKTRKGNELHREITEKNSLVKESEKTIKLRRLQSYVKKRPWKDYSLDRPQTRKI